MAKATDISVKDAMCVLEPVQYRGGKDAPRGSMLTVEITVESKDGKHRAQGFGSVPLDIEWAWPSTTLAKETRAGIVNRFTEETCNLIGMAPEVGNPIDLIYQFAGEYGHQAKMLCSQAKVSETMPAMAQVLAASPVDAALHDAFGKLLGLSSFDCLSKKHMTFDLGEYLNKDFAGEYLDAYTLREPKASVVVTQLVSLSMPLTEPAAIPQNDSTPESLESLIGTAGIQAFKVILPVDDVSTALERLLAVDAVCRHAQGKRGRTEWTYTLAFERADSVTAFAEELLGKVRQDHGAVFGRIIAIDQPVPYDPSNKTATNVNALSKIVPVIADTAAIDFETLDATRAAGYSGVALRIGKGHTECLLMAAAASKFGLKAFVYDNDCSGAAYLHQLSLAARLPNVDRVEAFARQHCPAGNKVWARSFPDAFQWTDGRSVSSSLTGPGLGF